jgi:hypothetical protein
MGLTFGGTNFLLDIVFVVDISFTLYERKLAGHLSGTQILPNDARSEFARKIKHRKLRSYIVQEVLL